MQPKEEPKHQPETPSPDLELDDELLVEDLPAAVWAEEPCEDAPWPEDDDSPDQRSRRRYAKLNLDQWGPQSSQQTKKPRISIVFEDSHFIAINKPSGYSTISERWKPNADTVIRLLAAAMNKKDPNSPYPHVVHRLDKDTSGLLLFAKHRDAQIALREQFRLRSIQKTYWALTAGRPQPEQGMIEVLINDEPKIIGRMKLVRKGGKQCQTEYQTIERFRDYSLVELRPKQGRKHQIRICLQSIGHSCAVDPFYGNADGIRMSQIKRGYRRSKKGERPLMDRLTLHAQQLKLAHPISGEQMLLTAELPKDFNALLKQLRKWGK